tara:strand:- start:238 stop:1197 length:960 start_codon:yes stop_codon:yes gene_type:complete
MKKLICVVGGGYWGMNHIRTLESLGFLGGVVDSNKNRLEEIKENFPNISVFNSLQSSLSSNQFSAFVVATPAETHYDIASKIIDHKFHVLVEKPLSLSVMHAQDLLEKSKANNVNLMVGHVLLFHPAIIKIKELIMDGHLGNVQYIYSNRLNLGQVRTQENVFWSLAPHDISIFQYFMEEYPVKIKTHGSDILQKGIQDSTITVMEYMNNVKSHIFVSWLHPFKEHRLVVVGSEAMVSYEDSNDDKQLKLYQKKFEINDNISKKIDGPVKNIPYENQLPLTEELKYFINHLDGKKLEKCNAEHALEVTKILVDASRQLI